MTQKYENSSNQYTVRRLLNNFWQWFFRKIETDDEDDNDDSRLVKSPFRDGADDVLSCNSINLTSNRQHLLRNNKSYHNHDKQFQVRKKTKRVKKNMTQCEILIGPYPKRKKTNQAPIGGTFFHIGKTGGIIISNESMASFYINSSKFLESIHANLICEINQVRLLFYFFGGENLQSLYCFALPT